MRDIIVIPEGNMVYGSDVRAKIDERAGGAGANQASWLALNHVPVSLMAKVGLIDLVHYQNLLISRQITPLLVGDENLPTGHLVTIVDKSGERSFFTDRSANINFSKNNIGKEVLEKISLLNISGYAFFAPKPREAALYLLKKAKEKNIAFSIDPASSSFLKEMGIDNFLNVTRGAKLFFPNEEEAMILSGSDNIKEQVRILGQFYDYIIIKRGKKGSLIGNKKGILATAKAVKIKIIDSSGAGDAFLGGFIGALRAGKKIKECLIKGNEMGAMAGTKLGAQPQLTIPSC